MWVDLHDAKNAIKIYCINSDPMKSAVFINSLNKLPLCDVVIERVLFFIHSTSKWKLRFMGENSSVIINDIRLAVNQVLLFFWEIFFVLALIFLRLFSLVSNAARMWWTYDESFFWEQNSWRWKFIFWPWHCICERNTLFSIFLLIEKFNSFVLSIFFLAQICTMMRFYFKTVVLQREIHRFVLIYSYS